MDDRLDWADHLVPVWTLSVTLPGMSTPDPYSPGEPAQPTIPISAPVPPRRRRTLVFVVAGALAVVAVLAVVIVVLLDGHGTNKAASATPSPSWSPMVWATETPAAPPPPTNTSFALGDTISTTSTSAAGSSSTKWTVTADKQYRRSPDGYQSPQNGVFYSVKVSVSVSEGSEYIFADDFALIGPDGSAYQATSAMYGFPGALQGTTVGAGQNVSGLVVFDVPQSALAGGKIELRPDAQELSNGQAFWALS